MTNQETSQAKVRIAANIDRGIAAKGFTNRHVGERIGKTEHQVWRWRRGKHQPDLDTLASLAEVLFDGDMTEFLRTAPSKGDHEQSPPVPARAARVPGARRAGAGSRNLELASERGDTSPVATAPVRPAGAPPGAPDLDHQGAPGTPTGNGEVA